ncbi:serine/threonine-protein kinase [Hyalangium rubrum]|uniref:Serine/threonine-protein kinase n=1 Tax=Hyalangium rubrum TaxID=3103134 RepID=A0ABU5H0H6_9BACT|nr:serine/threonine-protein kinase [Hyalangium sp. s54d21]MDY7226826.1 serine/threonine-protein kinase [Hyalangium sp. s54d21]
MERLLAADPSTLSSGTLISSWRVVSRRGCGSYGVVYRVEREGDPRAVPFALKLALHPLDPRFEREGELLLRINHPHVPKLEERGWVMLQGGVPFPYLVMEWVEGVPLYEWAAGQRLTSRQVLRVLAQVARALEATHAVQGVHRDVKGGNVLVHGEDAKAVLMDFGSGNFRGARTLTRQPPPPGTPQYQSPECLSFQWENLRNPTARYEAGPADDVYALGMTAYRLVTGRYPERGAGGHICAELAPLIHRMLSEEPSSRGSAREVAEALERTANSTGPDVDQPITSTRQARLASARQTPSGTPRFAVAVGMFLVLGVWWTWKWPRDEGAVEAAQQARDGGEADAGTVGLADTVRSIPVRVEQLGFERSGIGLNMPKKPIPGQRRPPCEKPEVEINGGCWIALRDAVSPCGDRSYEWQKGCYLPMFEAPQPSTSDPPNPPHAR